MCYMVKITELQTWLDLPNCITLNCLLSPSTTNIGYGFSGRGQWVTAWRDQFDEQARPSTTGYWDKVLSLVSFKWQISILGIYLLLLTQDLKLLWFCFFFTGSVTYIVIVALLAVLVVIVLFVLALCCRRRCKASNSQQLQTLQGTPETSSDAGSVATTDSGNLSNDIIIGW